MNIEIGDSSPRFEGYDNDGNLLTSDDFLGSVTVVFFYLKDNTPVCTQEVCDFRDAVNELKARGVAVVGISPDSVASHLQFNKKHNLNFSLISDPDLKISSAFGVVTPKGGPGPRVERTTFVIDGQGKVRWVERSVHVEEHVSRVLAAIDSLESA